MRILIVEDEVKLTETLERGLEEQGYAVDVVHDGQDGLLLAQQVAYDLVLLDVMLPGMDGLSVAKELRARKFGAPILMLTARDGVNDRVRGLDGGADDYLVKPFAYSELLARIRALMRRGTPDRDPILRVADLEIDTSRHEVRRAGQIVWLATKEYAVLEYLVRNLNRVVSREQIAEHVWDFDFVSESNVVDVYIRYLRRKLDDQFTPHLIHTVRGAGYQIKAPG